MNEACKRKKAVVIGAGASGLVTAKYLLESTDPLYEVTVLEAQPKPLKSNGLGVGGTFINKVYDGTRLVSSKYITAFSDFRMVPTEQADCCYPITHTNHPSATDYVKYLEAYAEKFHILKCIKFGCKVISLKTKELDKHSIIDGDVDENGYIVQYQKTTNSDETEVITEHYDVCAVCSGLHNVPNKPENFIEKSFKGSILHSSEYKDSSIFDNKRVLILGSGETAMDIALRAVQNSKTKSVALNVRRGFLSIPHNLAEDRPLDVFITNLFEHSYEHPWVHALRLRWILSTIVIRFFLFLTGSSVGFNQWACETTPVKRGYHIINKSHGAMSHLNVPIKSKSLLGRFWMKVYGEEGLRPIESFHKTSVVGVENDGKTIRFDDGRTYEADLIIMATGYRQSFPFLDETIQAEFRQEAMESQDGELSKESSPLMNPKSSDYNLKEEFLPSQHFITGKKRPRLGFIGFVRPNVGAIPPMSELQVMWWLCRMKNKVNMLKRDPKEPPSYMVLGAKYQYGVDYGNYMHRVSEDIGAAPSLANLWKRSGLKGLFTYSMGQSHIPLFRLEGPFASELCWSITSNELWQVCLNRGFAENFGLVSICVISLWMNLAACVLELLWCCVTFRKPKFFTRY